jgi:hypothetical protein
MIIRAAPLLIAALALSGAPARAQDSAEDSAEEAPPAAEAPADASAPAQESPAEAEEPPPAEETPGEPESAPAPALAPAPAAAPATPPAPPPSPFTPDQRSTWLAQCRSTFQRVGAALGGGNGLPDACDKQLLDFERDYVPRPDGQPPVIYVRVPVTRAAPAAPDAVDADVEPDAGADAEE